MPWDQSLPFAHVHHLKASVHFLPLHIEINFLMVFLTSLGKSIRSLSCFDNILIIISFVRTNLSQSSTYSLHLHL